MVSLNAKGAHTMNDWTDKIYVKNGNDVHGVKDDCDTKEAEPSKARHFDKMDVGLTRFQRDMDGKVELECPSSRMRFAWRDTEMLSHEVLFRVRVSSTKKPAQLTLHVRKLRLVQRKDHLQKVYGPLGQRALGGTSSYLYLTYF